MKPIVISSVLSTLLFTACGSSSSPQTISGRVSTSTFPYPVDVVRAMRSGREVASGPVAADGAFTVVIPAGTRYRLEFAAAGGRAGLVFPRTVGAIDATFDVRGGGAPFDLGAVRYIGDPAAHTYRQSPGGTQNGDDVECEDGVDPSGAVCVDDDAEESGSCEAEDDGVNCEDGIDPATGNECDGGPAANQDDGEESDGDGETDDGPDEGAVADHNLPSTVGCDGEHENEGEEEGEH